MKFLNKLYRFTTKNLKARRVSIFLSVTLVAVLMIQLCVLVPSLVTAFIALFTTLMFIAFSVDTMFDGEAIDCIEDKIQEFKKFK